MKKLIWGIVFIFVLFTQVNAYADLQIYGYVYDENNEPLDNVKVSTSDNYNVFNATTEDSGYYTLSGLRSEKYTLKYEKSGAGGGNSYIFGFVADAYGGYLKGVTVTLDGAVSSYQSQTKEIDLTTVSGYAAYQVERVTLVKLPSTSTSTTESKTTGKDSAFQFNNLSAGDYTLTCEKDGYQTYTKGIRLGNSEYYDIGTIALEKVATTPTPSSTPTQIDITGYWKGYFSTSLIDSQTVSFKLTQFKKSVNGTLQTGGTGGGARGIVTGKVNGDIFKFKVKETTKKCKGTFKGTATITANDNDTQVLPKNKLQIESTQFDLRSSTSMYMEFTLTGRDCLGKHKNGEGYVIKQ